MSPFKLRPFGLDHRNDRQSIFSGECKVSFIVGWDRHDRAGAIGHQDVVRDPDRDALAVDRVEGIGAGEHAGLFLVHGLTFDIRLAGSLLFLVFDRRLVFSGVVILSTSGCSGENTMKVAPHNVSGRVVKISILVTGFGLEDDRSAFAASDPVGLQGLHALGPIDFIERQQFIGIFRGLEEPLFQFLLDHGRAAAFADAVLSRQPVRAPVSCCLSDTNPPRTSYGKPARP